jgi:hypothetical protein
MREFLFQHVQSGPYNQVSRIEVSDKGNGLPIDIIAGDSHAVGSHSMSVREAELYHRQLGRAIKKAKKAGLG